MIFQVVLLSALDLIPMNRTVYLLKGEVLCHQGQERKYSAGVSGQNVTPDHKLLYFHVFAATIVNVGWVRTTHLSSHFIKYTERSENILAFGVLGFWGSLLLLPGLIFSILKIGHLNHLDLLLQPLELPIAFSHTALKRLHAVFFSCFVHGSGVDGCQGEGRQENDFL